MCMSELSRSDHEIRIGSPPCVCLTALLIRSDASLHFHRPTEPSHLVGSVNACVLALIGAGDVGSAALTHAQVLACCCARVVQVAPSVSAAEQRIYRRMKATLRRSHIKSDSAAAPAAAPGAAPKAGNGGAGGSAPMS